ncbi:MAG: hypothetical protein AAF208_08960 [Cyanobacteria bacterium P01_A01_bin.45]
MAISRAEAKQLLNRIIFEETVPQEWVQDVWGLSPMLGDSAAKLLDAFEALIEYTPESELENLLKSLYEDDINF